MPGKSGHADQRELLHWLSEFQEKPRKVFVNHGEDQVVTFFAGLIQEKLGVRASAPYSGAIFNLASGEDECEPDGVLVQKKTLTRLPLPGKDSIYGKLTAALARLTALVGAFRGRTNKDVAKFADQINMLCDKWQ